MWRAWRFGYLYPPDFCFGTAGTGECCMLFCRLVVFAAVFNHKLVLLRLLGCLCSVFADAALLSLSLSSFHVLFASVAWCVVLLTCHPAPMSPCWLPVWWRCPHGDVFPFFLFLAADRRITTALPAPVVPED